MYSNAELLQTNSSFNNRSIRSALWAEQCLHACNGPNFGTSKLYSRGLEAFDTCVAEALHRAYTEH
jgi:hypothetical protein